MLATEVSQHSDPVFSGRRVALRDRDPGQDDGAPADDDVLADHHRRGSDIAIAIGNRWARQRFAAVVVIRRVDRYAAGEPGEIVDLDPACTRKKSEGADVD